MAYAIRATVIFIALLCVTLMVCGFLYIWDVLHEHNNDGTSEAREEQEHIYTELNGGIIQVQPQIKTSPVIALDAGHGGVQPGCEFDGVLEKDITLSVVLAVKGKLEDKGYNVLLTRSVDEDVRLVDRAAIANRADADCFVSIHCNSFVEDMSVSGFEGYYYRSIDGKQLSDHIVAAADKRSIKTRGTKEENYLVLREADMPAVLLEIGYLSNTEERQALISTAYQDTVSTVIAEGIVAWIENTLQ